MEIIYSVDNYFQGFQLIFFDGWLLSWTNRETGKEHCELTTLGM